MTRQRPSSWICSNPNCPHEIAKKFNDWVRTECPDSSFGFLATDLDFILYNYNTKKLMLLEIKTRNRPLEFWQEKVFENFSRWLKNGLNKDWTFLGFHIIKFQNTFFNDGKCYLDNKEITEKELKIFLSKI